MTPTLQYQYCFWNRAGRNDQATSASDLQRRDCVLVVGVPPLSGLQGVMPVQCLRSIRASPRRTLSRQLANDG